MSDAATKPEQTVIAVDAPRLPELISSEPISSPAEEGAEATPAPKADEAAEAAEEKKEAEPVKEEKPEPKEISQGTLSKTHGGLLSFFKLKRFFYFQDEAIPEENLKAYLQHKTNSSKATAAYASQTGKGLWFYSKDEGHKEAPHGIIKLADVTEVTESGSNKFVLKSTSGDLHFEAPPIERNNWVFTLKSKIVEAKAAEEEITASEGYKAVLEKLTNPPVPVVAPVTAPISDVAPKVDDPKETDETKPAEETKPEGAVTSDEEAGPSETKPEVKRSHSKKSKRLSGFAPFFGKKEKPVEKEEEATEATETPVVATEPVVDAAVEPKEEEAKAAEPTEEEARAAEEVKPEPKKNNRHSIFSRFGKREEEKKEKEVEAPAAETEGEAKAVTETPVIETPTAEKTPSSPKSDLLSFFGKRDKSPAPKAAVVEDKAEEPTLAAAVEEPVVEASNDVIVTPPTEEAETPVVAAPKEKRKSSFFGFGKEKKVEEKKSEDVRSDSEDAEIIAPKPSTSPVPKSFLGGLKRKVSKAGKAAEKPEAKEVVTPAAVPEEEETAITLLPETAEPVKTEPETTTSTEAAPAIGDVVAEAVTAGKPVQATA